MYSRSRERAKAFAGEHGIPRWSADLREAVLDSDSDIVVVGLPNSVHREAVRLAAGAGKAVLCTKPLGRSAAEALEMLSAAEKAGVFSGCLEDLVYTPKTLKALESVRNGVLGRVLWARSRETHPGPHSAWFWDPEQSGGGGGSGSGGSRSHPHKARKNARRQDQAHLQGESHGPRRREDRGRLGHWRERGSPLSLAWAGRRKKALENRPAVVYKTVEG